MLYRSPFLGLWSDQAVLVTVPGLAASLFAAPISQARVAQSPQRTFDWLRALPSWVYFSLRARLARS